jgi:methionine synthase I (cobalamin-dependent)
MGLASGECPDAWNITHPEDVGAVASKYVEAGSAVILTNTFRSNRIALEPFGLAPRVVEINAAGVRISRSAAGNSVAVFASMGPSGKMLMSGDVTDAELRSAFAEQAAALVAAGADAIVVETMSDLDEAGCACEAARASGVPVVVSMVFDSGRDHDRTMMGATPEEVARTLSDAGADVIGANCGVGPEGYIPVCARLRSATTLPLWIKPNAGLPELVNGSLVYRTTPAEFAAHAVALRRAGADFIGGCCGTTPEFIRMLRQSLTAAR